MNVLMKKILCGMILLKSNLQPYTMMTFNKNLLSAIEVNVCFNLFFMEGDKYGITKVVSFFDFGKTGNPVG